MDIYCPHCGTRYDVSAEERGRKALCEVCNNKFIIGESLPGIGGQKVVEGNRTITCPHCGTGYEVNAEAIGQSAQCGTCGRDFVVGATKQHVGTAASQSARKAIPAQRGNKIMKKSGRGYAIPSTPDYEENKKYFRYNISMHSSLGGNSQRNAAIFLFALAIPILIGGLSSSSASMVAIAGFIIIFGLLMALIPVSVISDAEIDRQAKMMGSGIEKKALDKMGIDLEEVSMAKPVKIWGYRFVWPSVLGDDEDNKAKWVCGEDYKYRSSEVTHTIFLFGEHSVYCYEKTASLVGPASRDSTEEYFYKDIVSVRTDSKTVPWRGIDGTEDNSKSFRVDLFILTNSGGERRVCEIANPTEVESATKAFRALLKQKKF